MDEKTEKVLERGLARARDYKRTFATEHGKRVLYDLLRYHFVMDPVIVRGDTNGFQMAYNEGQRNVVLRLLKILNTTEEEMKKIMGALHAGNE